MSETVTTTDATSSEPPPGDTFATRPVSAGQRFRRRFIANRPAVVALVYLALMLVLAVIGPWITPHDPNVQSLGDSFASPFAKSGHWLGTDELGRDVLSRLMVATRVAMIAAGQSVGIAIVVGVPLGLVAGYFGRWVDMIVMRLTDSVQSFPGIILAIAFIGIRGPGLTNAMLAVGIIFIPNFIRITRASVLEIREETFIEASRSIGTPTVRVLWSRVLPNILPPLLVQISLSCGFALLAEASLSLLGLGVQLPQASWGSMLGRGYQHLSRQSWLIMIPGIVIALTVLAFNVLGDGLRDSIGREVRRER